MVGKECSSRDPKDQREPGMPYRGWGKLRTPGASELRVREVTLGGQEEPGPTGRLNHLGFDLDSKGSEKALQGSKKETRDSELISHLMS